MMRNGFIEDETLPTLVAITIHYLLSYGYWICLAILWV
jgi:hypothetical protein